MAINCSFTDNEITELKPAGVGYKCIKRYGTTFTPVQQVKDLLIMIRQGVVTWVQVTVNPVHLAKPTLITKLCRAAHRAGAEWMLLFKQDRMSVKPLETLRRHK